MQLSTIDGSSKDNRCLGQEQQDIGWQWWAKRDGSLASKASMIAQQRGLKNLDSGQCSR
jgi:hypothetical protein